MIILSHEERAERRSLLATEAKSEHPGDVARRHGVTERLVRDACREHDVAPAPSAARSSPTIAILAGILHGLTPKQIHLELGVSKVRIHQIKREARKLGDVRRGWPRKSLRTSDLSY